MKCDELNEKIQITNDTRMVYLKSEVDAAIAELKAEINRKEAVEKRWFERCMEARAENVMLKRALWLARAKRATEKADSFIDIKVTYNGVCNIDHCVYPQNNARRMLTCDEWLDVWTNVWEKCLKKAKEYK